MDVDLLVQTCLPKLFAAGLIEPTAHRNKGVAVKKVQVRQIARLWGGMGYVHELNVALETNESVPIIVKRIELPANCTSIGDRRKKASYLHEIAFYENGHAAKLREAGAAVPLPLYTSVENDVMQICMTKLTGNARGDLSVAECRSALTWLATMHALYWGRTEEAIGPNTLGGLQQQGCYWYLDTRPDEWENMPMRGWEGRLKLAAKAIDLRLKADPYQTICMGDAKTANMIFSADGACQMYDFQYAGKAVATHDVAYMLLSAMGDPQSEGELVEFYHAELSRLLELQGVVPPELERLRTSYELSCCDIARWMSGWGWWGWENLMRAKCEKVLFMLDQGKPLTSEAAYVDAMQRAFPV
ncbi:hypothetical protein CYMTET_20421 [Cymbomonas tetramitiformis]|uniref:Aminoglycoside phosphotransferase domain-containing protein n=1 Tax=Cymbomonas tetramitiformis TaxID=36881 RepID=A0AAE0L475_9CHLO|nr:hypothetical protein CYMTET_20421 [Cymbomonas tetramitiformis]|eukprot:gene8695-10316_t